MGKPKMTYFQENDVLHLLISEEHEAGSVEISPNITAELNDKGELIGIVGPNGSGKTTLFNIIYGVFLPEEGRVFFDGKDITRLPAYKRAPLGLGRTFQIPRPFNSASVRENVGIGAMFGTLAGKVSVDESLKIADKYIELVGLGTHKHKESGTLTPVEKKLMEIARALAMKPKLLLMDEAMAGMNPKDIDQMVEFLLRLKEEEHMSIIAMVETTASNRSSWKSDRSLPEASAKRMPSGSASSCSRARRMISAEMSTPVIRAPCWAWRRVL